MPEQERKVVIDADGQKIIFIKRKKITTSSERIPNNSKMSDVEKLDKITRKLDSKLNHMLSKWCIDYDSNPCGGIMRATRGSDIETFVRNSINYVGQELQVNLVAKQGCKDKKELLLQLETKKIVKQHQVDVHIYLDDVFISVVECKAYLDSCYYVRACDDFTLFKKFDYSVGNYILTMENSIDEDTKEFTDAVTNNVCDGIFCMLDGKRSSSKPIYNRKFFKNHNHTGLKQFLDYIYTLCNTKI